jgi:DNA gyrase subunit A
MEIGLVEQIDIDHEMQQAYLDYAMSVIVARALPDARDGLKPVHRRILYAMYDMGLRADVPFKKSARIVGEVLGKYHPHGDMTVYEAMARMAQGFSMRYLLVDGQGNFGSLDGDPPAAMRYTEARLTPASIHMLADIAKDTVNFDENFDGTLTEPNVLPAAIPNLLVNGATGIAVGMATSIPPHNLGEVVDALQYMLKKWDKQDDISIEELFHYIKGPDFPTGGVIIQGVEGDGLISAYSTGRGRVTVQASAHLEEMERGRNRIIITELPYMTNKSSLIERIADLARNERIEGIVDLRDESDRQGMRIVIELSKTADPDAVLRDLYRHTPMQSTFSIIMLALVSGEPRHLSLKQALRVFLEHRLEVIRRRSEHDLEKARQRAHILIGLRIALQNLDDVIALIRRSPDVDTARVRLMKRHKLSEIQAQAILDMPLRRLAALERKKIEDEYKEVTATIKNIEALLKSPRKMRQVVGEELEEVKEIYGDRRRTQIVQLKEGESKTSLLTKSDLLEEKSIWISVDAKGLISRSSSDKLPRLSGREAPLRLVKSNTRDVLYLVAEDGNAAAVPVHALPETDIAEQGAQVHKISPLRESDTLVGLFSLPNRGNREQERDGFDDHYILTVTCQGMIKKSALSELPGASASLFVLCKVNPGDRLGWVQITNGENEILLATASGMAIRFREESVRPMGLVAAGVMGIKLQERDELAGIALLPQTGDIFMVTAKGRGKRVKASQFPTQGRNGQGVAAWKLVEGDRIVGVSIGKGNTRASLHLNKLAPKTIRFDDAPLQNRTARGGSIQNLKFDQRIFHLTVPWDPPRLDQVQKPRHRGTKSPAVRSKNTQASQSGKSRSSKRKNPPPR